MPPGNLDENGNTGSVVQAGAGGDINGSVFGKQLGDAGWQSARQSQRGTYILVDASVACERVTGPVGSSTIGTTVSRVHKTTYFMIYYNILI